jgi:hypothetical protein
MDAVAIETFAEWKLLVNAIQQNPPKFELDEVRKFLAYTLTGFRIVVYQPP